MNHRRSFLPTQPYEVPIDVHDLSVCFCWWCRPPRTGSAKRAAGPQARRDAQSTDGLRWPRDDDRSRHRHNASRLDQRRVISGNREARWMAKNRSPTSSGLVLFVDEVPIRIAETDGAVGREPRCPYEASLPCSIRPAAGANGMEEDGSVYFRWPAGKEPEKAASSSCRRSFKAVSSSLVPPRRSKRDGQVCCQ